MAQTEILLPKMGESVAEATIIRWLKNEGDRVEADEPIVEIATDKVDSEVPVADAGFLIKKLVEEGQVVQVGQPIAIIGTEAGASASPAARPEAPQVLQAPEPVAVAQVPFQPVPQHAGNGMQHAVPAGIPGEDPGRNDGSGRFLSPLVRNIAKTEGVSLAELEVLPGSGREGRVTKKDILGYIGNRVANPASLPAPLAPAPVQSAAAPAPAVRVQPESPKAPAAGRPAVSIGANDEIVEMDRMRKLIAEHMVMSKHTSPHVTSFVEADVTNIVLWREKWKKHFEEKEKQKLTYTPIFIEAIARAIKDFPGVNASVDGDRIILRKDINIGMAAALPSGNLIVPVIRNADRYNLVGLSAVVNDLADRAKKGKLQPDEIQGGTYTVSNVGTFGNVMGTPIINQPQVAILAIGAIRKKPAVIETEFGDAIGIRHMMFLSHSYDHRVVDGMLGGSFVRRVADYLEQWDVNRQP